MDVKFRCKPGLQNGDKAKRKKAWCIYRVWKASREWHQSLKTTVKNHPNSGKQQRFHKESCCRFQQKADHALSSGVAFQILSLPKIP